MKTRSSANIPGARRTSDAAPTPGGFPLRVTTAHQSAARDQLAIAAGIPSFQLMTTAGTRVAEVILRTYADRLAHGVVVFAGNGNNGGDAYIVAAQLARAGVAVRLVAVAPPRTADAQRAARLADPAKFPRLVVGAPTGQEQLVVDGVLGTGHRGALREPVASHLAHMATLRAQDATIVAIDVPSGLDATTGAVATGVVSAHCTVTFGTVKRGLLIARAVAGRIVLVDIGLGTHAAGADDAWELADAASLAARVPPIAWDAHKGQRAHLAVVGGSAGMAGAVLLAARAALASGIGLVRAFVETPGVGALQQGVPQAIARRWDGLDTTDECGQAMAIGPGLGRSPASEAVLRTALARHPRLPVVLDADALTLLAMSSESAAEGSSLDSAATRLRRWCGDGRPVVCTPHPGEFARLTGAPLDANWEMRAGRLADFAQRAAATVLLKGTPTLIATPALGGASSRVLVMPRGAAVLATGGSGDMLTGIIGTLLAQGVAATDAALLGATVHAVAAEQVMQSFGGVRGATLDDVWRAMPQAWRALAHPASLAPGVLAEYPSPVSWC